MIEARCKLLFGLEETGASDYRSDSERRFLQRLHEHSQASGWFADAWHVFPNRTVVTVTLREPEFVTLRVDFFGPHVVVGYDDTHQLVDELRADHPSTQRFDADAPESLADFAGTWIGSQISIHVR